MLAMSTAFICSRYFMMTLMIVFTLIDVAIVVHAVPTVSIHAPDVIRGNLLKPVFRESLARDMALFSSAAYCSNTSLMSWTCSRCNGTIGDFTPMSVVQDPRLNTQAYVGFSKSLKSIVVAFRGTVGTSIKNWIYNLEFLTLSPYPNIPKATVHEGFYNNYNEHIRSGVVPSVLKLHQRFPDYAVILTGHSMGAAMSALCALELRLNNTLERVHVYNFGQPRLGNDVLAKAYNALIPDTFRLTRNKDMVPHLPPTVVGFHHISTEVWIEDNSLRICNGSGEDPSCSDSVLGDSISDHLTYMNVSMNSYCY